MNGITAEELMDCWEVSGSAYDAEILSRLWALVPPEMRLARLSADAVPGRYRGGFAGDGKSYPLVDVGGLPGPMRQEMTWCMFRIIELGGRVQMPGTVMLARRLTEITTDHRAGTVRSLMDLPARTWLQQIPLAVHRRRGKLPAPSSVTQMRQVLLRFLWLLDLPTTPAHGGSESHGTQWKIPASRFASMSRWDARPSTSTASPRRGCAAARNGTTRSRWKLGCCAGRRSISGYSR